MKKGLDALSSLMTAVISQGIVSERDVLRHGCGCINIDRKVKDIMTPKEKLITVTKDSSIADVSKKMDENKIRHLPVMDGDKVIGVVSVTDVINELRAIRVFENEQLKNYISLSILKNQNQELNS